MDSQYTSIEPRLFSISQIERFSNPQLVVQNSQLIQKYNLENIMEEIPKLLSGEKSDKFTIFSQAYAGHQFGHFNILGDGRAHIITEIELSGKVFDVQLKGSGATPYSRGGDGKANLSAMLREHIISEAMYALGIPTNRSLGVYTTGEEVWREKDTTGAILVRLASSHIRIGTFAYISYLDDKELLQKFTDYTIDRHFPELTENKNKYIKFLEVVGTHQIDLIINWMRIGLIHGVMNTDNTFISGETLDYGPCAFINTYHPQKTFSSIDTGGRYSFINQKSIIIWNLTRLIETLLPLIDSDSNIALQKGNNLINAFEIQIEKSYSTMMHQKIGLTQKTKTTETLISELLSLLEENKLDYTNSFVSLEKYLEGSKYSDDNITTLKSWIVDWEKCIEDKSESISLMKKTNPKVIPRNHLVEKVLASAGNGDHSFMNEFLKVLATPYSESTDPIYLESYPNDVSYETFCGT